MPNICIVGVNSRHEAEGHAQYISSVMRNMSLGADAIVTIIEATTMTCDMGVRAPYLIVRNTNASQAAEIAKKLNIGLKIDVEVEVINDFLPAQK